MLRIYLFVFLSSTIFLSCEENQDSTHKPDFETDSSHRREIEKTALSFFEWYISSTLNDSTSVVYDFEIGEAENGKCRIDSSNYFSNLRDLGTISEKFISKESLRVENCANFISSLNWKDFLKADAYEYQNYCDHLYHYYWTRTQEQFHGVEAKKIEKLGDHYLVTLVFYYDYGEKEYIYQNQPIVKVEDENGKWKIIEIGWTES